MTHEAKIFLVDDHEVVRFGLAMALANFLEDHDHYSVSLEFKGMARTGQEALDLIPESGANFALMDVMLPDMSGLEVIRRLRQSGFTKRSFPIIVVTELVKPNIREIFQAGANGYIDKQEDSSVFLKAISDLLINPDQLWMMPSVAQQLQRVEYAIKAYGLTPHEIDILQILHYSNPEIAELLHISVSTVRTHLSNIYDKLNVSTRKDAVEIARRLGITSILY